MQTSRRSILKGGILASLAGTMGATAMSASAAEKPANARRSLCLTLDITYVRRWS